MRRTIFTLLFISLFASAFAQSKGSSDYKVNYSATKGSMVLDFSVNSYKLTDVTIDGVTYTTIGFENGVSTSKKGFAELPIINATLQLNAKNDVVLKVEEGEYVDIKLEHPMLPSRGSIYRNQDPTKIPYTIAPEANVDGWYPENLANNEEPFVFRDTRGVNIYAHPFRYNAAQNTLRVYRNFKVNVVEDNSKNTNPLKITPNFVDPAVNDMYKSLYINYTGEKFSNQLGEWGEMLVIYTSRDADAIAPYIEWKRQKGFTVNTQVVSTGTNVVSTISSAYSSNPNLLYVQLVGDWADIKSDLGTTSSAPTDPYMGCVSGSDYYPELIIGRFSGSTAAQITVQVNKAINYEKNPDMSGTWYNTALGIASSEGSGSGDDSEADNSHMDVIKNNKLLTYTYTTVNSQYASSASASGVASYVNAGVGIINYCGHGSETYFVTSGYSNTNVNASTNGSKLPFIFSVACVNGKFHMTSGDCFAEAWLKKENGGAVATIMSTINQPWQPPMRGQDYFNDILIGGYNYSSYSSQSGTNTTASDQRTTFGSITFNGNVLMLAEDYSNTDTRETFQTWTIFGDASLQVRTATPSAITVTANNITGSPYSVTVTSNGSAVANARVAIYQNGTTYTATTNSSGVATITHNLTSGTATLTATAYNYGTYQGSVTVGGSTTAPSTPTGLASSNITTTGFTLNWNATSGATSYSVKVGNNTYTTTTNSYTATGLSASTSYTAQVAAVNSYGTSSYCSAISVTTATAGTAPSTPTGLTTSSITTSSATLGWTAVTGASSYTINVGGTTYTTSSNSYSLTGLSSNTAYSWKVMASNSYGSSSYSASATFTTSEEAPVTGQSLPFSETFSSVSLPTGWTTQNSSSSITERWSVSSTNKAGGSAYEMKCAYQNITGTTRLVTPAINTQGVGAITVSFSHFYDAYKAGPVLKVQTSNDLSTWTDSDWSYTTTSSNISATTVSVDITGNLNSQSTYIAFVVTGNLYYIDYWYIDNVSIVSTTAPTVVVPTITTVAASSITSSTAIVGGNVTDDGNGTVTARGICYSTQSTPTTSNTCIAVGTGTGSFTATLSALSPSTKYYARAYATNAAGTAYGSQITFTSEAESTTPVSYCTSKGNSVSYEWIDLVQFEGIDRTSSADGGYIDMTSLQATVNPGSSYTIYFSAGFKSSSYTEYWAVWIDFNQDGTFSDDEKVASGSSSSSSTLSATVAIPSDAQIGTTRMRVSMKYNAAPTSCETFSYGEVEDYSVNITARRTNNQTTSIFAETLGNEVNDLYTIYPNPTNNILNITFDGLVGSVPVSIYDVQGRLILHQDDCGQQTSINVESLPKGVYLITVEDEKEPITKKFIKL